MAVETAPDLSLMEALALLPPAEREAVLEEFTDQELVALEWDWGAQARPKQLPPDGDWFLWLLRAGRGFGKTRTGAQWMHQRAMEGPGRWIAMVAKTPADARDYMIEGPGGILKNTPPWERPVWSPTKRRITWSNGSWATIYSSEEPDQLRGFSGDTAWLDEFAKWKNPRECWDNLMFGMREASADRPRVVITTTPRPLGVLAELEDRETTVVVTGSSYENRSNLDPRWFSEILGAYEGTRLGRQEIHAEILGDVPGALWSREMIEAARWPDPVPEMVRVVVAIDPAMTAGEDSDETGMGAAGKGWCRCQGKPEEHAFVIADLSGRFSPDGWGKRAVEAYRTHEADRVVAEVNNGGDMVEHVLRTVDPGVSYRAVHASRGKRVRAEPVAALYEQGKVHHVDAFPELEDQMATWVPGETLDSPDRVDWLVWALTDLMLQPARRSSSRFATSTSYVSV